MGQEHFEAFIDSQVTPHSCQTELLNQEHARTSHLNEEMKRNGRLRVSSDALDVSGPIVGCTSEPSVAEGAGLLILLSDAPASLQWLPNTS